MTQEGATVCMNSLNGVRSGGAGSRVRSAGASWRVLFAILSLAACRRGASAAAGADAQAGPATTAAPAPVTQLQANGVPMLVSASEPVSVCAPRTGEWVRMKVETVDAPQGSTLSHRFLVNVREEEVQVPPGPGQPSIVVFGRSCATILAHGPDRVPVRVRATVLRGPNEVGRIRIDNERTSARVPVRPGAPSVVSFDSPLNGPYEIIFPGSFDIDVIVYEENDPTYRYRWRMNGVGFTANLSSSSKLLIDLDTNESRLIDVFLRRRF